MKTLHTLIIIVGLATTLPGQTMIKTQPKENSPTQPRSDIVGVLGAFPAEVEILLSQLVNKRDHVYQRIRYVEGTLRGQHVVVAFTGIGKVNAALSTILLIEHFNPKYILFSGIAGAINPELNPGDIVIGNRIAHHDYGTLTPEGITRRPTRDPSSMTENPEYYHSDSLLTVVARDAAKSAPFEKIKTVNGYRAPIIVEGVIVTGDVFVASNVATAELRKSMNAEATEMEGASIAQVCYQQQTPFMIIRSMSDNASSAAAHDMETFYQLAAKNSASLVMTILQLQTQRKK